ncbi:peroxidasin homolog isoform X2 [Mytilus californianus]|uniref:peroxidasin homolog isoform X2 n=1 Tax=Mytilus californianus TaxID=6549 RepID=UPI0022464BD9|nr:peroxidasin homolog isoform X2 [Mytilus californianus]
MVFLQAVLVFTVTSVICQQTSGNLFTSKDVIELTEKELESLYKLETLLGEKERINKERKKKAKRLVLLAIEEGLEKSEKTKERQTYYRNIGIDRRNQIRRKNNRLFKISKMSIEKQEEGFILLSAKKALVKLAGKTLKELSGDPNYREAWDDILAGASIDSRRRKSTKRATTNECQKLSTVNEYRTIDGTCNNLDKPYWGKAFTSQPRFIDEVYSDGVNTPRISVDGASTLTSPRTISNSVFKITNGKKVSRAEGFNSLMSLNWGQFLDHDIVLTPTFAEKHGEDIRCCEDNSIPISRDECLAIEMSPDEDLDISCMEFVRSAPSPDIQLNAGNQVTNAITSFIDGSMVYGSSEDEERQLRGSGGKMKVKSVSGGDLLPEDTSGEAFCTLTGSDPVDDYCQNAGDIRVNVQPGLGHLHLLFVREHNRIVDELKNVQPSWTEDQLYNEARKIVGAIIQHITYNEYFANLFGDEIIDKYGLRLLSEGYSEDYNKDIHPGTRVGVATAALRFGHTQIPHEMAYLSNDYNTTSSDTEMQSTLKNPHLLVNKAGSKILDLVRYMTTTPTRAADREFEGAIRNHLFNGLLDLTSLNIQRGRDHGLPSYTAWREYCDLSVPVSDGDWGSLTDLLNKGKLRQLYKSVHDIDLYVGGILERRMKTGRGDQSYLGPTFACILGKQFQNLKLGDRFWYERPYPEGFREDQLQEIRKVTLATVLCANTDGLTELQTLALKRPGRRRNCNDERFIPKIDFNKWI